MGQTSERDSVLRLAIQSLFGRVTRDQLLAAIRALPADPERSQAYHALTQYEALERASWVVMCACEDWTSCAHPWPSTVGRA